MSPILDLPSLRPGERIQDTFLVLDAWQFDHCRPYRGASDRGAVPV